MASTLQLLTIFLVVVVLFTSAMPPAIREEMEEQGLISKAAPLPRLGKEERYLGQKKRSSSAVGERGLIGKAAPLPRLGKEEHYLGQKKRSSSAVGEKRLIGKAAPLPQLIRDFLGRFTSQKKRSSSDVEERESPGLIGKAAPLHQLGPRLGRSSYGPRLGRDMPWDRKKRSSNTVGEKHRGFGRQVTRPRFGRDEKPKSNLAWPYGYPQKRSMEADNQNTNKRYGREADLGSSGDFGTKTGAKTAKTGKTGDGGAKIGDGGDGADNPDTYYYYEYYNNGDGANNDMYFDEVRVPGSSDYYYN